MSIHQMDSKGIVKSNFVTSYLARKHSIPTFVASIDFVHEIDSECEFNYEENVDFLENIVVEYWYLIEKFLKVNIVVDSQKS